MANMSQCTSPQETPGAGGGEHGGRDDVRLQSFRTAHSKPLCWTPYKQVRNQWFFVVYSMCRGF